MPDAVAPGVLTLNRLHKAGILSRLSAWLPLSRKGGYTAPALVAALVVFLLAPTKGGIRPFFEGLDVMLRRRIAAVGGLRLLPTAASLSRACGSLTHQAVRPFLDALLPAPISATDIFSHPHVHHLDANGDAWHVVDMDPTVKGFRQRDLPEGDEYLPPVREAPGQPGYTGRKRGELRIRAFPAIHDGTGLWLALRMLAAEGSIAADLLGIVSQCLGVLKNQGVSADRVIFRGDGEFGSAAALQAIVAQGTQVLVRISRYELLSREQVAKAMETATWTRVRFGESGVPRDATEVGTFRLIGTTEGHPEAEVRVIATRIPCSSEGTDVSGKRGIKVGAFRIELFATTLDAVAWPASDLAELYLGRSTIENRFLQEDRELDLGRTFSENPAGQEFIWGIGLFLWNEQVCAGWAKRPPPKMPRHQEPRPDETVAATSGPPPAEAAPPGPADGTLEGPVIGETPADAADANTHDLTSPDSPLDRAGAGDCVPMPTGLPPAGAGASERDPPLPDSPLGGSGAGGCDVPSTGSPPGISNRSPPSGDCPPSAAAASAEQALSPWQVARAALGGVLRRAFSDLTAGAGWTIDAASGSIRCPNGERLIARYLHRPPPPAAPRLSVRTDPNACAGCVLREKCFPEGRRSPYKQVSRTITQEELQTCDDAFKVLGRSTPPTVNPRKPTPAAATTAPPASSNTGVPPKGKEPVFRPPVPAVPGPWKAERPTFLPAAARKRMRLPLKKVVRVELVDEHSRPRRRRHELLAAGRADRAHRRRTHAEISASNRHDLDTRLAVTVEAEQSR